MPTGLLPDSHLYWTWSAVYATEMGDNKYDLMVCKGSSLRALVGKVWFTVILNGFEVACTDGAVQK